jgi:hypothetical protein
MTRWVAFIQLFSFDLVHKPGKSFTMPDGLSRQPVDPDNKSVDADKETGWIKPHPGMGIKHVDVVETSGSRVGVHHHGFWKRMKDYLGTLTRPSACTNNEFQKIKRRSQNYFIEEDQLKKRSTPFSQVIISVTDKQHRI